MEKLQLFDVPVFLKNFEDSYAKATHRLDGTAYVGYLALAQMNRFDVRARLIEVAKYGSENLTLDHVRELVEKPYVEHVYQKIEQIRLNALKV